jgi:hypothetical protein
MIPAELQMWIDRAYAPAAFALIATAIGLTLAAARFEQRLVRLALAQLACIALLLLAAGAGVAHAVSAALALAGLSALTLALGAALIMRASAAAEADDPPKDISR